jgi:hypothetical protein
MKYRAKSYNGLKIQLGIRYFTNFCKTNPILLFYSKYLGLVTSSTSVLWRLGSLGGFPIFIDGKYDRIIVRKGRVGDELRDRVGRPLKL